jgi:integrase
VATLENRSRYCVSVKNRDDLTAFFPFSKFAATQAHMASLRQQGLKPKATQLDEHWLVRIRQTGFPAEQATFKSRAEAEQYVLKVEEERSRGLFVDYTKAHRTSFAEVLVTYMERELTAQKKSAQMVRYKIEGWLEDSGPKGVVLLQAHRERQRESGAAVRSARFKMRQPSTEVDWIHKKLSEVTTLDIEDFIKERLEAVEPGTVDREIDILQSVFRVAINSWDFNLAKNPMNGVRRPKYFNERDRRLRPGEEKKLREALTREDLDRCTEPVLKALTAQPMGHQKFSSNSARKKELAKVRKDLLSQAQIQAHVIPYLQAFFDFQLMTAARRSETLKLKWSDIDFEEKTAFLAETKNGRPRKLSLREDLVHILRQLPQTTEFVFPMTVDYLAGAWGRACHECGIVDLHVHDLRHEAISVVAETGHFSLPELQQFSGHRDVRMLMRYAHLCASRLAHKLDACFADKEQVRIHHGRRLLNKLSSVKVSDVTGPESTDATPLPRPEQQLPETSSGRGNVIEFPKTKRLA